MLKSLHHEARASAPQACIEVICVHSGLGGRDPTAHFGPSHLRMARLEERLSSRWPRVIWRDVDSHDQPIPRNKREWLPAIARLNRQLSEKVEAAVRRGNQFLVLGGDHSCAVGTWSGVHRALRARGEALGLIWIDAHMDAHVPETTPSGNWHGMPVAHLLGYGEEALTSLAGNGPAILPQNLCLIGQRSWEEAEAKFLRSLEVRTITMPEIERIGMGQAFTEALWRVSHGPARFGISLDLDVFDPSEAPGVGSPVPGGAKVDEVLPALAGVGERPDFVGLELVEFDPRRDRGGKTVEVVRRLVAELWKREPDNE